MPLSASAQRPCWLVLAAALCCPALLVADECPAGAQPQGEAPPAGLERLCVKPDGTPHGKWRSWYANGQPMSERDMRDGQEHGIQRSWWPNGQLMMEGVSVKGDRYPGFKFWSATGELTTLQTPEQPEPAPADPVAN